MVPLLGSIMSINLVPLFHLTDVSAVGLQIPALSIAGHVT